MSKEYAWGQWVEVRLEDEQWTPARFIQVMPGGEDGPPTAEVHVVPQGVRRIVYVMNIRGPRGSLAERLACTSGDALLGQAVRDVVWLAERRTLAGVAEIIRERRLQIEQGYGDTHDVRHHDGWLMHEAVRRVQAAGRAVTEGTGGPEDVERGCRQGGALLAAETDRLVRRP